MLKRVCVLVLLLTAVACSGSSTAPSTTTGTLAPSNSVTSYPVTLNAAGVITVSVTSVTPSLAPNVPLRFFIGVPNASSACTDDASDDLWLVGSGSTCIGGLHCTTSTIPASVKRTASTGSFCVGVENVTNTSETYTLTITAG